MTNHGVLGIGLLMMHLHQLFRVGSVDPTQHTEPTAGGGQTEKKSVLGRIDKKKIPLPSTRGNFVPTH